MALQGGGATARIVIVEIELAKSTKKLLLNNFSANHRAQVEM